VLQELDRKIADLERQLEALKTSRQTLVTPSSSLTPAEIAFANDDFPNIVNLYTAILDREPRNTTALYRRAYGLQKLGRHVEAVRDYTWYLGLVPEDPKALNNRAASYLATGNRTYAEQDLATLRRLEAKTTPVVAATSETGPGCTSSGSCYGDISTITGRPKTVHVDGYYRKDGTYVRPHYRSTPSRRR
jgi:tetratricopeptide (TPR) repeat protein